MDFRCRSKRVPRDIFPSGEVRIHLGNPKTAKERTLARKHNELLHTLARQGQWDVLASIKAGNHTVEEVAHLAKTKGLDALHLELRAPGLAPPLGEAVADWLATVEQKRTAKVYRIDIRRLVEFVGPDVPVNEVGRHHINDLLTKLKDRGLADNTRAGVRTACSAFFTWFEDRDQSVAETTGRAPVLKTHPVRRSKQVRPATTRHRFLSPDEYGALLDAAPPDLHPQYATLTYAGLRIGEFINLPPEHVILPTEPDITAPEYAEYAKPRATNLYKEAVAAHISVKPFGDWGPKGHGRYEHGTRDVPIHRAHLLPLLAWYERERAGERSFFVNPRTGRMWTYQAFREQLRRDCERAGLEYGAKNDGVTAHTCRHTLGSWLAQQDVQLKKIAMILGDTTATVERFYAHLIPGDLDETINRVL